MEVTPPPSIVVDPAIDPREGAAGASLQKVEQLALSEGGSAAPLLGEHVDINALDVAGALLILIAEVREALTALPEPAASSLPPLAIGGAENSAPLTPLPGDSPPDGLAPWPSSNSVLLAEAALMNAGVRIIYTALGVPPGQLAPAAAPVTLIQMMLQRLPAEESQQPVEWLNLATQVEGAVRSALDKAVEVVTAWRDVPPAAIAVVGDARTIVLAALDEDPPSPLWLMPEMMPILPRMQRYWRLRRRLRRSLDQEETTRGGDREDAEVP
jgi:hypothetical protein